MKHVIGTATLWIFGLSLACSSEPPAVATRAQDDSRVVAQITGRWAAEDGTELLLCEREDRGPGGATHGCQPEHVIRGEGRSKDEDVTLQRSGCGGLCFNIAMYVGGWLRRPGEDDVYVSGELMTAREDAVEAYRMPYELKVAALTSSHALVLTASMAAPDRLEETKIEAGAQGATRPSGVPILLRKADDAGGFCPPPAQVPGRFPDDARDGGAESGVEGGRYGDAREG